MNTLPPQRRPRTPTVQRVSVRDALGGPPPAGALADRLTDPLGSARPVQRIALHVARNEYVKSRTGEGAYAILVHNSKFDTREEAIQAIASQAAVVGKAVDTYNVGKNKLKDRIDPFKLRLDAKYKRGSSKVSQIKLTYQMAQAKFEGYVVNIEDTGQSLDVSIEERNELGGDTTGIHDTYSHKHGDTGSKSIKSLLSVGSNKTKKENEQRIDAYTKIAGEGARWQAVRNHTDNLANDSKFFTHAGPNDVKYVTFVSLWKSWLSAFGKGFDIDDQTVASKLKSNENFNGGVKSCQDSALVENKDYNLDKGEPWTIPVVEEDSEDLEVEKIEEIQPLVEELQQLQIIESNTKKKSKKKKKAPVQDQKAQIVKNIDALSESSKLSLENKVSGEPTKGSSKIVKVKGKGNKESGSWTSTIVWSLVAGLVVLGSAYAKYG